MNDAVPPLPQPPPQVIAAAPLPAERVNILIVDDRADKRLVFRTILDGLKQNVVAVESGEAALKWLLENDCAVVLLDVNMPGMDGLETAELIRTRKKSAHTPIIFITSYVDDIHTERGYSLGAVDYIVSPVMPNVLRSKVRAFVEIYNMNQELKKRAEERVALVREQAARTMAEQSQRRASFLAEVARVFGSSLDVDAILAGANRTLVPFLADYSAVMLDDGDAPGARNEAAAAAWAGHLGAHGEAFGAVLTELATRAIARGAALAQPAWPAGEGMPEVELAAFPLVSRGQARGVLVLGQGPSRRRFGPDEMSLAESIAERAASALDNCLLFAEIQKQDQRKNEFLATLSHELRNPLAPLRTALHTMRLQGSNPDAVAQLRTVMERQVTHMTRLVEDLLDVARITRGAIELRREVIDINHEIRAAVEACQTRLAAAGHTLDLDLPAAPIYIDADQVRMQQVFENLLMNAIKYTERGGRIAVRAAVEGNEVVVRFVDSGIGIAPERMPVIWQLFVQVDDSIDRTRHGLGIGLALVKDLVTRHGGRVTAESAGLGKGSTFTVRLPLAAAGARHGEAAGPAASAGPAAPADAPLKVLVVDDNVDAADTLCLLLELMDQRTHRAHDGGAALEAARDGRPDLIFLDIGLPVFSGLEVAAKLRERAETKNTYLVALSGYGTKEDRMKSLAAGFDEHLAKPLDPDLLPDILAAARARTDARAAA